MKFKINKNIINIIHLKDQKTDFNYWQKRSMSERLEALESLRQQFYNYTDETTTRFQRVLTITKRK
jgi:hypothetical protein